MNTRYLAILVTLALLGFSAPAAAHPCERFDDISHKHCVAETPQTTFKVDMELDDDDGSGPVFCEGTATGNNLGPSFTFPATTPSVSCGITLTNGGGFFGLGDPVEVCLLGASVRISKKRTRVMIFMYSPCNAGGNVFRTLELPADVDDTDEGFIVTLKVLGPHELKKNHEPNKERPLEEEIFIGDIVYTDPEAGEF